MNNATVWIVIAVFWALVFTVGIYIKKLRKIEDAETFMVAGREVGVGLAASSMIATWIWAGTVIAAAEGVFSYGIAGLWIYGISSALAMNIAVPVIKRVRDVMPRATTYPEFGFYRAGAKNHVILAFVAIYMAFTTMLYQLIGGGIVMHALFGMDFVVSVLVIAAIYTSYSVITGLWGVMSTDYIQMIFAGVIGFIIIPWMVIKAGGYSAVYNNIVALKGSGFMDLFPVHDKEVWNYFIVSMLMFINCGITTQVVWQRAFATKYGPKGSPDRHKPGLATLIGGYGWWTFSLVFAIGGTIAIALGLNVSPSEALPAAVKEILPPAGGILLMLAMLSAITSTGDSGLSVLSTLAVVDIYKMYIKKDADQNKMLKMARVIMIIASILAAAVSILALTTGVSLLWFMYWTGVVAAAITMPLIFSVFWAKANRNLLFASMIISITVIASLSLCNTFYGWPSLWVIYVAGYGISTLICLLSKFWPESFDYSRMQEVHAYRTIRAPSITEGSEKGREGMKNG